MYSVQLVVRHLILLGLEATDDERQNDKKAEIVSARMNYVAIAD